MAAGLRIPADKVDVSTSVVWPIVLALAAGIQSRAQNQPPLDLAQANIEDLMNLTVTSVSKRQQTLAHTAAAVFVVQAEDIRRSGALNLPDVLRMVPGVDVEQINASSWAISIRGFDARYSNKVLVLIDGRTVYSPSFSGVYWEHLDMPLEDIERIEVIRGPGATVWGANAVNGVISIITKSSKHTQGGSLTAGGGSQTNGLGLLQYGGSVGQQETYRAFAEGFSVGDAAQADGSPADDRWQRWHTGFRSDWDPTPHDSLMVEGDLSLNKSNQTQWKGWVQTPYDVYYNQPAQDTGGNLLARWDHRSAGGAETSLQTYYDTYRRTDYGVPEVQRIFDLDFQDHLAAGGRNDIVWGVGFRSSMSGLSPGDWVALRPPWKTDRLFSAFLQDEIRLSNSLWLTAGCKIEHNAYTGFEPEPSLRLAWAPPGGSYTVWAAASRAMRQPSRVDTAIWANLETVPIAPGMVESIQMSGNPNIKPEELRDYELGYRREFSPSLSLDADVFFSIYHHLESVEPLPIAFVPGYPVQVIVPLQYGSGSHGVDSGGEVSLNWNASPRWRIRPGYAYLNSNIRLDPAAQQTGTTDVAGDFPRNMLKFRSVMDLSAKVQFDQSLYYSARVPGSAIPGHARLDLRLSRKLGESAELSVVGQNLLRPRTWEFGNSWGVLGTQVERSVYGQLRWRF